MYLTFNRWIVPVMQVTFVLSIVAVRVQYALGMFKHGAIGWLYFINFCIPALLSVWGLTTGAYYVSDWAVIWVVIGPGLVYGSVTAVINHNYYKKRAELFDGRLFDALCHEKRGKRRRLVANLATVAQIIFFAICLSLVVMTDR